MQVQLPNAKDVHYHLLHNTINVIVYVYEYHTEYQVEHFHDKFAVLYILY